MRQLKLSLTTFLKIAAKRPRGKIGEIRRFTGGGGYDFYKVMKKLATMIASGKMDMAAAKIEIAKIARKPERDHTLNAITKTADWMQKFHPIWSEPPRGTYVSASKLVMIKLEPEFAFRDSSGSTRVMTLWNLASPELKDDLAAEGLWLLASELVQPRYQFEIMDLRVGKILTEKLIKPASGMQLKHDLLVVEEIWKDLHNSALSTEDTISHISSLIAPPP